MDDFAANIRFSSYLPLKTLPDVMLRFRKIFLVSLIFALLVAACGKKKIIYQLPNDYQVEGYWEATGFMDAGTVFEVYKINQGFLITKKRVGYAVDWRQDLITASNKPRVEIFGNSLIVESCLGVDTLLIRKEKY